MVGAFGVGRISNVVDTSRTNTGTQGGRRAVDPPHALARGGEIGRFELGSTVILLFEPDRVSWTMHPGEVLRLGRPIADLTGQ